MIRRDKNGSDADEYYELIFRRKGRRWEAREESKDKEKKQHITKLQQGKVAAAYELLKGEGLKLALSKPLALVHLLDHLPKIVSTFSGTTYCTERIKFIHSRGGSGTKYGRQAKAGGTSFVQLTIGYSDDMLGPFVPLMRASRDPIKLSDGDGMF